MRQNARAAAAAAERTDDEAARARRTIQIDAHRLPPASMEHAAFCSDAPSLHPPSPPTHPGSKGRLAGRGPALCALSHDGA
eukprot:7139569-Prymnesium_polylepis.2